MTLRSHPSAAKAWDIDHVRFCVPDLDAQAAFLSDFGLEPQRDGETLLGIATDGTAPYRAETGDAAFIGFGLRIKDEATLDALTETGGARRIDDRGAPAVAMTDPNGWEVRAVVRDAAMPSPGAPRNEAGVMTRGIGRYAPPKGPSDVMRLGHVVLRAADFAESRAFYQNRFGLLASDEIEGPDGAIVGGFFRCDRQAAPTDHHTVFLMQSPDGGPAFEHAAFEVRDIDALMAGHDHLAQAGRHHDWGVGRHVLGAHVFDYWRDPSGFELEHWTDGDVLDAHDPAGRHPISVLLGTQWGPVHPMLRGGDV